MIDNVRYLTRLLLVSILTQAKVHPAKTLPNRCTMSLAVAPLDVTIQCSVLRLSHLLVRVNYLWLMLPSMISSEKTR